MREQLRHPCAALAVLGEFASRAQQLSPVAAAHEGEALAFDERLWDGLAVKFDQLWFVIEKFQLAGAARHEKENDIFGSSWEMRWLRRERVDELQGLRGEQSLIA